MLSFVSGQVQRGTGNAPRWSIEGLVQRQFEELAQHVLQPFGHAHATVHKVVSACYWKCTDA